MIFSSGTIYGSRQGMLWRGACLINRHFAMMKIRMMIAHRKGQLHDELGAANRTTH